MKLNIQGRGPVEAVQHLGCETFTLPATGEVVKLVKDPGKDLWDIIATLHPTKKLVITNTAAVLTNTVTVAANTDAPVTDNTVTIDPANTDVVVSNTDTVTANSDTVETNVIDANTEAPANTETQNQGIVDEIKNELNAAEEQINEIVFHKKKKK